MEMISVDVKECVLISKLADMIYRKENMQDWTEDQFFSADLHSIVAKYGVDEELIDNVVADLTTYFDY